MQGNLLSNEDMARLKELYKSDDIGHSKAVQFYREYAADQCANPAEP
jgi:hypothetical protein